MLDTQAEAAVRAAAEGYCVALHTADADFLEKLCHDRFFMTSKQPDGTELFFDKATFVARARSRDPFEGERVFKRLGRPAGGVRARHAARVADEERAAFGRPGDVGHGQFHAGTLCSWKNAVRLSSVASASN